MIEYQGAGGLDYLPCRYGKSKLLFRGPKRRLEGAYCAMIGGTETYGKFVETPFPALVEQLSGCKVVNLGWVNAGVDAFANDPSILELCDGARVTVVQVLGAQNMSNRFYAVHPRRNDRFLRASASLKALYREVDFAEFHFTRHMLTHLHEISPERFRVLEEELKSAWVARMQSLASRIRGKTILLELVDNRQEASVALGPAPLFVDADMIAQVRECFTEHQRIEPSPGALAEGTAGMVFSELDAPAAAGVPGPAMHREVAATLAPLVKRMMR